MVNCPAKRVKARGFTLIELTVVLSVIAILLVIGSRIADSYARDTYLNSRAEVLMQVGQAADDYIIKRSAALTTSSTIANPLGGNIANIYAPTVQELIALGHLRSTLTNPFEYDGNTTSFAITVTLAPPACLPSVCQVNQVTSLTRPWRRLDVAGTPINLQALGAMVNKMGGRGVMSDESTPTLFVSKDALFTLPNPYGAAGHLAYFSGATTGTDPRYLLSSQDTRNPDLRGGLSVSGTLASSTFTLQVNGAANVTQALNVGGASTFAGTATFNGRSTFNSTATFNSGMVVTGTMALNDDLTVSNGGTVCVRLVRTGRIEINCDGRLDARLGTFSGPSGTVTVGDTGTGFAVDTAGRIRGSQGFYSAVGSVFGDNVQGIRVGSTTFTVQTMFGVDALAVGGTGDVAARNSLATPAIGLTQAVTPGTPCTDVLATSITAGAVTTIRAATGGGFVVCTGGSWRAVSQVATFGSACSPDGIAATSGSDGRALICRNGVYMAVTDLLSSYVTIATYLASDNVLVTKPACGLMGSSPGQAVAFILARRDAFNTDATINRYTIDEVGGFRVKIVDVAGNALPGEVIVETRCYY